MSQDGAPPELTWEYVAGLAMEALTDTLEASERPSKGRVNGTFWRFRDAYEKLERKEAGRVDS